MPCCHSQPWRLAPLGISVSRERTQPRTADRPAGPRRRAVDSGRRAAVAMLFVVNTIRFGIYLRPDRGRHFLKLARYRWRAPDWMARLVLRLGAEGAPPSATAAPQRRLSRARTGSWPGPASARTSRRWRPGRPASGRPRRPRPHAVPQATGRRPEDPPG